MLFSFKTPQTKNPLFTQLQHYKFKHRTKYINQMASRDRLDFKEHLDDYGHFPRSKPASVPSSAPAQTPRRGYDQAPAEDAPAGDSGYESDNEGDGRGLLSRHGHSHGASLSSAGHRHSRTPQQQQQQQSPTILSSILSIFFPQGPHRTPASLTPVPAPPALSSASPSSRMALQRQVSGVDGVYIGQSEVPWHDREAEAAVAEAEQEEVSNIHSSLTNSKKISITLT